MNDLATINLGLRAIPPLIIESLRATKGRFFKNAGYSLREDLVRDYFEGIEPSRRSTGMIASSSPLYAPLIDATTKELFSRTMNTPRDSSGSLSVLDYGCGDAVLYPFLSRFQPLTYTGFDIDRRVILYNRERFSYESAMMFTSERPVSCYDIVFAINLVTYLNDFNLRDFLTYVKLSILGATGGFFVLVDPYPSFIWETHFDGISLELRSPDQLISCARDAGLVPTWSGQAQVGSVKGRSLFPYATAIIFEGE